MRVHSSGRLAALPAGSSPRTLASCRLLAGLRRPEVKFGGLQELLARINTDIGIARSQLDTPQWAGYREQLAAEAPGQ